MSEHTYYVWRSDSREVETQKASSPEKAADIYALRANVPYGIALRVVDVEDVFSFQICVHGHRPRDGYDDDL